jgi:hypothetical protein
MGPNKRTARVAGLLYLVIIIGTVVSGVLSEMYIQSNLVVPGDVTGAANSLVVSEGPYRFGFAGYVVVYLSDLAVALLLYVLLKPVSRNLALLAAFFRSAEAVILGLNMLNHFAAFSLLNGTDYLTILGPDQLPAAVQFFLNMHRSGYLVGQAFFGLHCLVLGYLLFKSGYFPRVLGVFMVLASLAYLTESFAFFLSSNYAAIETSISWIVALPAFAAEISLTLWLLFKGVRIQERDDRAQLSSRMQLEPKG